MTIPSTMDELHDWLAEASPIDRARLLGLLVDRRNAGVLAQWRRAAVYEATREASHADVAAELGIAASSVNKAVTAHNATLARP